LRNRVFSNAVLAAVIFLTGISLEAEQFAACGHRDHNSISNAFRESVLDSNFHTYDEIVSYLDSVDQVPELESILEVYEIGYSTNEDLPIKAIKISDNPTLEEDEAALLFLGQCHAEEILGVEISMGLIDSLISGFSTGNPHIMALIQNLEIWVVPTHNPEGLQVVHDGWDVTYRKNKTDCNENGAFDFVEGIGWDIDGIDLNRQYDFNWIYGDAYLEGDYDYFRGFEPFSESEVQAVAALAREQHFVFSIAYHSARSGTPEIVYYSWEWEDVKTPPDYPIIDELAQELAARIINESGDGNYASHPGTTRRGNAHDWFYTQTGCIQFLVECGTNNLQPEGPIILDTVQRNLVGCFFLLDRALGYPPESRSQIRGIVQDASDNFPLEGAQVSVYHHTLDEGIVPFEGPMLVPRRTDEFGRYRRILQPGTYTLVASAPGFESDTVAGVSTSDSYPSDVDFTLLPMPEKDFTLVLPPRDGLSQYTVIMADNTQRDTLNLAPGNFHISWQGHYVDLTVSAEGFFPELHQVVLDSIPDGYVYELGIHLPEHYVVLQHGFEDLVGWDVNGPNWFLWDGKIFTQAAMTYLPGDDVSLTSPIFSLSTYKRVAVEIHHQYELEWDIDSVSVDILDHNTGQVVLHKAWMGQDYEPHSDLVFEVGDLPGFGRLRLSMAADSTVEFRGWVIDSIAVMITNEEVVAVDDRLKEHQRSQPMEARLSLQPNPVRNQTSVYFELPGALEIEIEIFDVLGRRIKHSGLQGVAGNNQWSWQGVDQYGSRVPAGIYFLRMTGPELQVTQKFMLLAP